MISYLLIWNCGRYIYICRHIACDLVSGKLNEDRILNEKNVKKKKLQCTPQVPFSIYILYNIMFCIELNRIRRRYTKKKFSIYVCVDGSTFRLQKLVERFFRIVIEHVLWIYSVSFGLGTTKRDWSCHTHFDPDV